MLDELYALCKNPPSLSVWQRFWSKVDIRSWTECWEWTSGRFDSNYGAFHNGKRAHRSHRLLMNWLHGELPASLIVDHIWCNNPPCNNPIHLVPTTHAGNVNRKGSKHGSQRTHCVRGHILSGSNLSPARLLLGERRCMTCNRQKYYESKPAPKPRKIRAKGTKTHCSKGHEFKPENLVKSKLPYKVCRMCSNLRMERNRAKQKSAAFQLA
jgi:hypothetical protein